MKGQTRIVPCWDERDNSVELEVDGAVVGKVVAPHRLNDQERIALVARGRELVARARRRNQGVSADVLAREVQEAVDEVRGRKKS